MDASPRQDTWAKYLGKVRANALKIYIEFLETAVTRSALLTIIIFAVSFAFQTECRAQQSEMDSLTSKDSPLAKGEVIAFFGDSITQAGAGEGGYCRLIGEAIEKARSSI